MIEAFDDIIGSALARRTPQRLVFLFVKAVHAQPGDPYHIAGARLLPVLSMDKVLAPELRFASLISEADDIDRRWDFVLIACLGRRDGGLPSSDEARAHLRERARLALELGDLSPFVVLDRGERPLWLKAQRALH